MKKFWIVTLVLGLLIISTNPGTIFFLKSKILNQKEIQLESISKAKYNESTTLDIKPHKRGIIAYDKKYLNYIKEDATRAYSVSMDTNKYDFEVGNEGSYFLDKIKRKVYIIDDSGNYKTTENLSQIPFFVRILKNGNYLVNFSDEITKDMDGVSILDSKGKRINVITIPQVSINEAFPDDRGNFALSGMKFENSKLYNTIMYYDQNGELIKANSVEGKLFHHIFKTSYGFCMVEENSLEYRGEDLELQKEVMLSDHVVNAKQIDDKIFILTKNRKLKVYSAEGKLLDEKFFDFEPIGIEENANKIVVYHKRGIYFYKEDKNFDFTNDIYQLKILEDGNLAVVFKGYVEFYKVK